MPKSSSHVSVPTCPRTMGHSGLVRACSGLARPSLALRISELVHYHCACRVDVSAAVFLGAVSLLRIRRCLFDVPAYVLSGAVYMGVLVRSGRPSLLCCLRVGRENIVSRPRYPALAHCGLGGIPRSLEPVGWKFEERRRICLRTLLAMRIPMRNRRASGQWSIELH